MRQQMALGLLVMFATGGCAGALDPTLFPDAAGPAGDAGSDAAVVLGCARAKTILAGCLACHATQTASANGGFDMERVGWEKDLVGEGPAADAVTSECKGKNLVFLENGAPPARGLFLDKLAQANPTCGVRMPKLLPKLSNDDLTCVQQWANSLVAGGSGQ